MGRQKVLKVHNKSDKPDNVVMKEQKIVSDCEELQKQLPRFMAGYFAYLKGNVLPMTRRAYLQDVLFFCKYLIQETDLTEAEEPLHRRYTMLRTRRSCTGTIRSIPIRSAARCCRTAC